MSEYHEAKRRLLAAALHLTEVENYGRVDDPHPDTVLHTLKLTR
jgi:hypothetical protein